MLFGGRGTSPCLAPRNANVGTRSWFPRCVQMSFFFAPLVLTHWNLHTRPVIHADFLNTTRFPPKAGVAWDGTGSRHRFIQENFSSFGDDGCLVRRRFGVAGIKMINSIPPHLYESPGR
jgi:hypothetical protein